MSRSDSSPPLWRNLNFTLMWSSVAASGFGDRIMQLAALALLGMTSGQTDAASAQAGIAFFFFLPYLFISPWGGLIADRLPRKWVMLTCDEVRAGLLALGFVLVPAGAAAAVPEAHQWKVYALIAAVGTMAAVFGPTRNATVPQLVRGDQLTGANGIIVGIAVIASLIGFGVGGPLVDHSVQAGLATAVGFFAVSGLFFAFLRLSNEEEQRPADAPPRSPGGLLKGLALIARHRPLRRLIILNALLWGAANGVVAASAAVAKHRLGIPPEEAISVFGYLACAFGAGMLTTAVALTLIDSRREGGTLIGLGLIGTAIGTTALALSHSFLMALASAFFVGFCGNLAIVTVITLLQSITPNRLRGRVFGVNAVVSTITTVGINGIIWQLPNADDYMVGGLLITGLLLALLGLVLTARHIGRGPFDNYGTNLIWRITRVYCLSWHDARWAGAHNVPADGPVILAPNHTTGLDPLLIQSALTRKIRWVMLTTYQYRILQPIWRRVDPVALDPEAGNKGQIRTVVNALKGGAPVGIFPEGRLQRAERRLQRLKPGVAMMAMRTDAPIVPVWIKGTPRRNSMIFHFLQPSRSRVRFGPPIPTAGRERKEIMDDLQAALVELAEAAGDHDAVAKSTDSEQTERPAGDDDSPAPDEN